MNNARLADGLYAITDSGLLGNRPLETAVEQAIRGGARVIQYREKRLEGRERADMARRLAELCRKRNVPLIINDDAALAAHCGASGVHLGRNDESISHARHRLGPDAIIGVSCYNNLDRALLATAEGADYVAFGRFFPSRSKPAAVAAQPALLNRARRQLAIPVVAIGGINPANGAALITAGANLLAAIEGVFGQTDIEAAARRYTELFL